MSDEKPVLMWEAYCYNGEHEGGWYCRQCLRVSASRGKDKVKPVIYHQMMVQAVGNLFLIRNVHSTKQHPRIGFISYEGIRTPVFIACFDANPIWHMADWNSNDEEYYRQSALKTSPIEQDLDHMGEIQSLKYLQPYSGINEVHNFEAIGRGHFQKKCDEELTKDELSNLANYLESVRLSCEKEASTDVPILGEYCWTGEPHEGGWCCRQCWEQQQEEGETRT